MKTTRITHLMTFILLIGAAHAQLKDAIRFRIHDLNGSGKTDECVIRFLPGATDGFDGSYDAYEMFSINPNVPITYTKTADSSATPVAINSLPSLTQTRSLDLFAYTPVGGNYKIESIILGSFDPSVSIKLTDNVTKQSLSLDVDTVMQFSVTSNDTTNARFNVEFKVKQVVSVNERDEKTVKAFVSNGKIRFAGQPGASTGNVQLYATTGALVSSKPAMSAYQQGIDVNELTSGIYVLVVKEEGNLMRQQIWVP